MANQKDTQDPEAKATPEEIRMAALYINVVGVALGLAVILYALFTAR